MIITKENIDDLNAVLNIQIEKNDYEGKVESVLKDYRKKANIKGFRPGMVPIGLIRKMYGKAVKVEEINKTISENIHKYLYDEKIEILGDPLPKTDEIDNIDFDAQDEFKFSFDLGLAPVFELPLSKKNKVDQYEIVIDDKMKNDYISNYTRRYGDFINAEVSEEKDILKGRLESLDEKNEVRAEGTLVEDTSLAIDIIKDEEIKKSFTGKKIDETIDFNIRKAYPDNNEIAGLLRIDKDQVEKIQDNFRFTIKEISRFQPAEIGPDLFNKIYGEDVVKTEDDFNKKIEEEIRASLSRESNYKLMHDVKDLAIDKTEMKFPEEFLKKWLLKVTDKATPEQIDKDFDSFRKDLKWQLIKNKVAKDNNIKITEEELQKEAENITRFQFSQYGLYYATDEQISNYAKETLKREDDAKRIADKILDNKVIEILKEIVKIEVKSVTAEEFNKLFE
ncbi:MAG TPA: trigger factor [Bacteroidales bacterium]|jgi:trigger factor|nr:trigger factor [Bacteroidales bacterium]NMD02273.1 trigger factor [Bacteroidales bacterium]OQB63304.1 MAG: Trigger factor [Bacteroidetes bacterium ADurb.Bin145]HQG63256.1 trigger factor [Bacteroidales bacterium]